MITGTPSVSKYYRVLGISRMDLTPAETTVTGVLPSSLRSALTSIVYWQPLWTPPIPPVTKTWMPAIYAAIIVAETVVAPSALVINIWGKSLLLTFFTLSP